MSARQKQEREWGEMLIADIRVDHALQSRVAMDMVTVKKYADGLMGKDPDDPTASIAPARFPAVTVFFDEEENVYWLADGFHRVAAYKRALKTSIPADIRKGTKRDAILYSVGANLDKGLRPSPADLKKAVWMLLQDSEWFKMNDADIGRKCGLVYGTVKRYRSEFCREQGISLPKITIKKHASGKMIEAVYIRKKRNDPPTYRTRTDNKYGTIYGFTRFNGKDVYLGPDGPDAQSKFAAILDQHHEIEHIDKAEFDSPYRFCNWLSARDVVSQSQGNTNQPLRGILLFGAACVFLSELDFDSIFQAIGRVRLFRLHTMPEGRMIVACHLDEATDKARELIELARQDGVEFLTPEQIVEQFASAEPKADGPEAEPTPSGA